MTTAVVDAEHTTQGGSERSVATPEEMTAPARGSIARFFGNIWAIARKELNVYFTTPIAYVLFAMFVLILGYFFVVFVGQYLEYSMRAQQFAQFQPGVLDQLNFTDLIISPLIGNAGVVLIFIVPFLTMRLIAEEKKQHTFELLMTTPVRSWEIVLGKFLSAQLMMLVAIGLTLLFPLILDSVAQNGGVEWETTLLGYLGLFLLASSFIAIGLFLSSLTDSQMVAALATWGVLLLMWVLAWASGSTEGLARELIEYACALTHLRTFVRGTLNLTDVSYFLSVIVLGLFLTRTAIEKSRW